MNNKIQYIANILKNACIRRIQQETDLKDKKCLDFYPFLSTNQTNFNKGDKNET